jgi:hypothetical protein
MKNIIKDENSIHSNNAEPILIQKIINKSKEKKFDIESVFDKDYKPGSEVKMAKPEKKKNIENLAFSFNTREQGRVAKSWKKTLPFG